MRYLVLGSLILFLGACGFTQTGTAIKEGIKAAGAQAYDAGLENAEYVICFESSIGSIMRRYGRSQAAANTWRDLCFGQDGVGLIGPSTKSH